MEDLVIWFVSEYGEHGTTDEFKALCNKLFNCGYSSEQIKEITKCAMCTVAKINTYIMDKNNG